MLVTSSVAYGLALVDYVEGQLPPPGPARGASVGVPVDEQSRVPAREKCGEVDGRDRLPTPPLKLAIVTIMFGSLVDTRVRVYSPAS